ncbi:UUP1 family membrane protein [Campylobacterota bacterium DY0563]
MSYKVFFLGFPLTEEKTENIWNIEAKISFSNKYRQSGVVSLILPSKQNGFLIINEESSSSNFGYTVQKINDIKKGIWSKREIEQGSQVLYYSIDVIKNKYTKVPVKKDFEQIIYKVDVSNPVILAAKSIIENVYEKSANSLTFTSILIDEFNHTNPSQATKLIKSNFMKTDKEKRDTLLKMIDYKGYKVRTVGALYLEDKMKNIDLVPMLEVFYKDKWQLFDINRGMIENNQDIFIWQRGSQFLLEAEGVKNSNVKFSITKNIVPARNAALVKDVKNQSALLDFSLFILPNETQNTFKFLLLVPLGALVVVFMRVFVGLKTSGTFMPILLSMAFIETQLVPGIIMFIVVVSMGLIVRSYMSYFNLLLVARISSVLIVVLAIMAFVAIMSEKLNLEYATSITFFPIIILSWTIERMSIIWEEEGAKEVFQQGGGSLIVSIIAFFAMTNSTLSFITFNFPEVLLAVLGLTILFGRYSGYRLSELHRFKSMVK